MFVRDCNLQQLNKQRKFAKSWKFKFKNTSTADPENNCDTNLEVTYDIDGNELEQESKSREGNYSEIVYDYDRQLNIMGVTVTERKQMKCPKTWKFKYKLWNWVGVLPRYEQHKLTKKRTRNYKRRSRPNSWNKRQYNISVWCKCSEKFMEKHNVDYFYNILVQTTDSSMKTGDQGTIITSTKAHKEDDSLGLLASASGEPSDFGQEDHKGFDAIISQVGKYDQRGAGAYDVSSLNTHGDEEATCARISDCNSQRLSCGKGKGALRRSNVTEHDGKQRAAKESFHFTKFSDFIAHMDIGVIHRSFSGGVHFLHFKRIYTIQKRWPCVERAGNGDSFCVWHRWKLRILKLEDKLLLKGGVLIGLQGLREEKKMNDQWKKKRSLLLKEMMSWHPLMTRLGSELTWCERIGQRTNKRRSKASGWKRVFAVTINSCI